MTDEFDVRLRQALHSRAEQAGRPDDVLGDVRRRARRQSRTQAALLTVSSAAVIAVGGLAAAPLLTSPDVTLAPAEAPEPEVVDEADPAPDPSPTPDPTPDEAATLGVDAPTCERDLGDMRYRLTYPADWWTDDGDQACRMFHPAPYELPEEPQDVPGMAITLDLANSPLEEASEPTFAETLWSDDTTIAGRDAVIQETELTEETLFPEGTRLTRYFVDLGDRTLVAYTTDHATGESYEDHQDVLDAMMHTLEIIEE